MSLRRVGLAALAGLLATIALLLSPLLGNLPPLVPPYVPIDLRFVVLPALFALLQGASEHVTWPGQATTLLGATVLVSVSANVHASEVLAYLGVPWAQGGTAVDLGALAASLAAVLVGLGVAFDAAHERLCRQLRERGLPEERLAPATRLATRQARDAIAVAGLAAAGLAVLVRLLDTALGGRAAPFPQLAAILLVVAAGALLLGLPTPEREPA